MNREEALAHGKKVHETKHSMKRRSPWHDYYKKGTYMLTLVVKGRVPLFGELCGITDVPLDSPEAPRVEYSELGNTILRDEIGKINKYYPQVEVWKVCIMPDHIHMIVRVKEDLPEKKHLGLVVRGFKTGCSRAWWRQNPIPSGKAEETVASMGKAEETVVSMGKAEETVVSMGKAEETVVSMGKAEGTVARMGKAEETVVSMGKAEGTVARMGKAEETVARMANGGEASVPSVSPEGLRSVLFEKGYNDKILMHEGQLDNGRLTLTTIPVACF